jgi:hypothetical protein
MYMVYGMRHSLSPKSYKGRSGEYAFSQRGLRNSSIITSTLIVAIWFIRSTISLAAVRLSDFVGCNIVGSGSDYLVTEKKNKRYLIEIKEYTIKELKRSATPYGSDI